MERGYKKSQEFYRTFWKDLNYNNLPYDSKERTNIVIDLIGRIINDNYIKNILEIGSGGGIITKFICNYDDVISLDIIPTDNIKFLIGTGKLKFVLGSVTNLPLKTSSVDLVIYSEVIEHLHDFHQKISIKEIYRVVSPSGYVILTTPNPSGLYNRSGKIIAKIRGRNYVLGSQYIENWIPYSTLKNYLNKYFFITETWGSYYMLPYIEKISGKSVCVARKISEAIRKKKKLKSFGLYQYYLLTPKNKHI